jgi:adenylosuccinate lyase
MGATIVRELECKLTPKEWKERARRLAQIPVERAELEEEAKTTAAKFKSQIDDMKKDERRIAREVREGTCFRDVLCHELQNFDQNTVELVRDDTEDVVEQRAMSGAERQKELGLDEPEDDTVQPAVDAPEEDEREDGDPEDEEPPE